MPPSTLSRLTPRSSNANRPRVDARSERIEGLSTADGRCGVSTLFWVAWIAQLCLVDGRLRNGGIVDRLTARRRRRWPAHERRACFRGRWTASSRQQPIEQGRRFVTVRGGAARIGTLGRFDHAIIVVRASGQNGKCVQLCGTDGAKDAVITKRVKSARRRPERVGNQRRRCFFRDSSAIGPRWTRRNTDRNTGRLSSVFDPCPSWPSPSVVVAMWLH